MSAPGSRALALAACVLLTSGCLRIDWTRDSRYTPVLPERHANLTVGQSSAAECLATLGAPLWVLELPVDGRNGALFAWGWFESKDVGLQVSYAFDRFVSASVDYTQVSAEMEGLVAVFDAEWRLVEMERGRLRDLTSEERLARPIPAVEPGP